VYKNGLGERAVKCKGEILENWSVWGRWGAISLDFLILAENTRRMTRVNKI